MHDHKRNAGAFGEVFAAKYLTGCLGWTVYAQNWRCRLGEVDIVAFDADTLVVVEVKTRTTQTYGSALEAVDDRKLIRLHRLLRLVHTLDEHCSTFEDMRVDIVALQVHREIVQQFHHLRRVTTF